MGISREHINIFKKVFFWDTLTGIQTIANEAVVVVVFEILSLLMIPSFVH